MKAVLINSKNRTVEDVEYNGDYRQIYTLIGCGCFTVVRDLPANDDLFVDDEGLLHLTGDTPFFTVPWYPTPLAGSGLILNSTEDGESADAKHDASFYRQHVRFTSERAVRLKEALEPTGWPSMTVIAFENPQPNKKEN